MKVIKDRQIIEDGWVIIEDAAPLPEAGDVLVSVTRWNAGEPALTGRAGKVGVVLRSSEEPTSIERRDALAMVAIDFPKFSDGRGYSHARRLREQLGYRGELRAVGNVLRDQLFYMQRCGMDSFALQPGKNIEDALRAFDEFSVTYQPAADEALPLFRRVAR